MLNRSLLAGAFLFFMPAICEAAAPNVVVVMADDIGLGDIGFYHRERTGRAPVVATPNIDALIHAGIRFSDAHSPASLCAPTRFSMLTGNYSFRIARPFGVWSPAADSLIDPDFTTSARIAKVGGYHTAFFGKWGCGGAWPNGPPDYRQETEGACSYGFDYACELPSGIQDEPFAFYENRVWMKVGPSSRLTRLSAAQTGYATSIKHRDRGGIGDSDWDPRKVGAILAGKAVTFIDRHVKEYSGTPFFVYYCSQAVHIPHTPPQKLNGTRIRGVTPAAHGDMIRELDVQV